MKKENISKRELDLLRSRLLCVELTNASSEFFEFLCDKYGNHEYKPLKIMVVGAGNSYASAVLIKQSLGYQMRTPYVEAQRPQAAVRILTQFDECNYDETKDMVDVVVGISYSGDTQDIKYVWQLCKEKGICFILITWAKKEKLEESYQEDENFKIISYYHEFDDFGKERGMLSMASVLSPVLLFDEQGYVRNEAIHKNNRNLKNGEDFVKSLNIHLIAKSIRKNPVVHVFYDWESEPVAIDLESKFMESGIANVVLHEKKNFSHGSYSILMNHHSGLVINLMRKSKTNGYDLELAGFLKNLDTNKHLTKYLEIGTETQQVVRWNIETISITPYLITAIGEELGMDASKPIESYHEKPMNLYKYEGDF